MGPLFFQVIINDAASVASANVWKYVDDITLASNVSNSAKSTLQDDLHNFVDWTKINNLTLNHLGVGGFKCVLCKSLQHQLFQLMMFLLTLLLLLKFLAFDCRMI